MVLFEMLALFLLAKGMNKDDQLEQRIQRLEDKITVRYEYDDEQVEDLT